LGENVDHPMVTLIWTCFTRWTEYLAYG